MPERDSHGHRLSRLRGLYGIVGDDGPLAPLDWARALSLGGAGVLQLRFKRLSPREALAVARAIREALPRALLLIDDRPDLALLCGADGVHVGDLDLSPADCRAVLGPALLIGATARSASAGRLALAAGADHLGVGPVFPSRTKPLDAPPLGLEGLARICRELAPTPIVAISGIDAGNIEAVARAGARAAAVIGAVGASQEPEGAARALAAAFERGGSPPAPALGEGGG